MKNHHFLWVEQIKHAHALQNRYCAVCLKDTPKLYMCGKCNSNSAYCSKECQIFDYKKHMKLCGRINQKRRKRWRERQEVTIFDLLSTDLISEILSYLSEGDRRNLKLTSQSLYNALFNSGIFNRFYRFVVTDFDNIPFDNDTAESVQHIKVTFNLKAEGVATLYSYFPNIQSIVWTISDAMYNDVDELKRFKMLRSVSLPEWKIDYIEPIVKLTRITDLQLISVKNTNLKLLSGMTQLERLTLGLTLQDITTLSSLTNLRALRLESFEGDITPLSTMTRLEELSLALGEYITTPNDLLPIRGLTNLRYLYLRFYNDDLYPLANLTLLDTLILDNWTWSEYATSFSTFVNLRRLLLEETDLSDISQLSALTNLQELEIPKYRSTLQPLSTLTNLQMLTISKETVGDFRYLSDIFDLRDQSFVRTTIQYNKN